MKHILKLYIQASIAFSSNFIYAQNVELDLIDCNAFKTTHYLEKSDGSLYSVQLEREISENLWALHSKVTTDQAFYIFSQLKNGKYRATLVETKVSGNNNEVYRKISNEVIINCPEQKTNEALTEAFMIFPNPAKNELFITSENIFDKESNYAYEILNILGQKIISGNLLTSNEKIELSNLESGTYAVVIKNNDIIQSTKKLLINKK